MKRTLQLVGYCFLAVVIIICDRVTKMWALHGTIDFVKLPFISYNFTFNRGISWGLLHTTYSVQFVAISIGIFAILCMFARYTYMKLQQGAIVWPLIMVLAGATSNMIDRCVYAGVIDFIQVTFYGWASPIFNVADIMIVFGIGCMMVQELMYE